MRNTGVEEVVKDMYEDNGEVCKSYRVGLYQILALSCFLFAQ